MHISEIVAFLRPNGGYVITGDTFDDIKFIEGEPFTKSEFEQAKLDYVEHLANIQTQRLALLDRLGLTEEEATLLLGGN